MVSTLISTSMLQLCLLVCESQEFLSLPLAAISAVKRRGKMANWRSHRPWSKVRINPPVFDFSLLLSIVSLGDIENVSLTLSSSFSVFLC